MQLLKKGEITRLDWDSNFFNINIGKCTIDEESENFISYPEFDLIYVFSTSPLSSSNLYGYVDIKVIFKKIINTPLRKSHPDIRIYDGELTKELVDLSIESGEFSRFRLDPKLSGQFESLYTEWIKNSINGQFADFVLVYELNNRIVGLVTISKYKRQYNIGLIAVSKKYRGLGIGSSLLEQSYQLAGPGNELRVATQLANKRACQFYQKKGFTLHSQTYIYHLWN